MTPGLLLYIPGAGTFTVVGSPVDPYTVNLVNSGDPNNAAVGTLITAGTVISPATQRGPIGPAGVQGPQGPAGPQGVGGASAYTTLVQAFTIPATEGVAFVLNAASFAVGLIVYVASGNPNGVYCSVAAVNTTANTLTLQNQNYPGGDPVGSVAPVGATISGTGPQGPQGIQGPAGPAGIQGPIGLAPTGTITMYGAPTAPGGWVNCDGTNYQTSRFPALFSVISTLYGATGGANTFNVPNLQGRFPLGFNATYPISPSASVGGEATHTLTIAELAAHTHTQGTHTHTDSGHTHSASQGSHTHTDSGHAHSLGTFIGYTPGGTGAWSASGAGMSTGVASANIQAAPAGGISISTSAANISTVSAGAISSTGSGTPHNNMPPYLSVNFIIKT
jgi:microcystin-dependent protein